MSGNDILLRVSDLKVEFDTAAGPLYAVRGVSFILEKGEALGIVGESGSGKSVTAASLLRLQPGNALTEGKIEVGGRELNGMDNRELLKYRGGETAMIFQEPGRSFDPIYNIRKTFRETLAAHFPDMDDAEMEKRTIGLLHETGIPEPEKRLVNFPHQFSGGQLQRIMIALALSCDPSLLIADEPTTALDVTIQAEIVRLLLKLKKERGLSLLFITHDIHLVGGLADRILVMYGGLVMEEGPADVLLGSPRHPYTRALLDAVPRFGTHYSSDKLQTIPGTIPDPRKPEPGCPFAPRCPLVMPECRGATPPVLTEGTSYRCLLPGVKK